MDLLKHGRKYLLTVVFIGISTAVMIASYVLAFRDKLTGDWVTLCTIFFPALGAATIGFQWSNAKVTAAWAGAKGDVGVAVAESAQPQAAAVATVQAGPTDQGE